MVGLSRRAREILHKVASRETGPWLWNRDCHIAARPVAYRYSLPYEAGGDAGAIRKPLQSSTQSI